MMIDLLDVEKAELQGKLLTIAKFAKWLQTDGKQFC
jgi:hypothetical protein